ncbi:transposase [Cutibacterium sp.]|uniref:transposase n=1 Tax=Cutibacterium sp. TaxID=1912221 RepID=UPI0026DB77D5|nr:transposase [Cutibacterium sp.]MDO4413207.1 transposase [Cutibacterium sp.]
MSRSRHSTRSRGYTNAIDDQLKDATCVLDAFHIVKLATGALDEVRRRIQGLSVIGDAKATRYMGSVTLCVLAGND